MSNITSEQLAAMNFRPNSITIASVYPIERVAERDYAPDPHGGRTKFVLKAAAKGEYTTLTVVDSWQNTKDILNGNRDIPLPVYALDIARDLISHWVTYCFGSSVDDGPGIMIIKGTEPTEEELAFMTASQKRMAERLIHAGDELAEKHQHKHITDVHRALARWMDYRASWIANLGAEIKNCKVCYSPIHINSRICKECKMDPDRTYDAQMAATAPVPAVEEARRPGRPPLNPPVRTPQLATV